MPTCSVCGGADFSEQSVLWDALVYEWQLAPHERSYVDRQQGTCCRRCGSNLRSLALADAIRAAVGTDLTLAAFIRTPDAGKLAILEINEAGSLSPMLSRLPGHVLASYPAVDMHAMPYVSHRFDLVVHSDTLEHVSNPIQALAECRRVLRPGGALCLTIPTIIGRLTRSRDGLPKSYHGSAEQAADDLVVHTEFGSDMWTYVLGAGFSAVSINSVAFPAALALTARKEQDAPQFRAAASEQNGLIPERVVSVHFPKAAGSSLRVQLTNLVGNALSLDYDHDPLTLTGADAARFPDGKRIVHGHFRAERYASARAFWMTFLRHPVDNLISIYFFWKSLSEPGHDLHGRFLREHPTILDFARYMGVQRLMSDTYFGSFDMSRFDFIGFYESWETDILRLGKDLGLPLLSEVQINKTAETSERLDYEADASLRQRLTDLLADDVAFYERLRSR